MAKGNKFGTFEGVFTPSILTILGVIMYMRLPWVVGNGGLHVAIGIIFVAHVISITTGLSVSSIATDKSVKGGGPYYIISRSLGLPLGGTLGLALCVGLAFSISLYIIGFTESLLAFLDEPVTRTNIRFYGSITLCLLTGLTFFSTKLAIQLQFPILLAIVASLFAILLGPSFVTLYGTGDALVATSTATAPFEGGKDMAVLFGIFFPAVTGFTAGVNMSGDLRDAKRSIPRGTLASIGVGMLTYIGLAIWLAVNIPAHQLVNNPRILLDISLHPFAVYAGIWGATLSSALGSILGAPRILQALSKDRITPRFFARGYGRANEPRNALLLVFLIAASGIAIAELDAIARIVSMFFIATYGFLNLSAAVERWASPDFRPEFKIPVWVSILGLVTCILIMIKLDLGAMLGSVVLLTVVFAWLKRRELQLESGDTWAGVWSSVVRSGLHHLEQENHHRRNWLPNIICFSRDGAESRAPLLDVGHALVSHRGVLTDFELTEADAPKPKPDPDRENPLGLFHRRLPTENAYDTMGAVCRYHGFSGVEPNTVMLDWNEHRDSTEGFYSLLNAVEERDFNLLVLAHDDRRRFGGRERLDVWLTNRGGNVPLSLNLIRFLTASDEWHRTAIRFLVLSDNKTNSDRLYATTRRMLDEARIEATVKVINNAFGERPWADWVREESADADLTVAALPGELNGDAAIYSDTNDLIDTLGSVLLIRGSTAFEETALFDESAAITTAEVVIDQDAPVLKPLTLPQWPDAAIEVKRLAHAHEALMSRFHERSLGPMYGGHAALLERLKQTSSRYFTSVIKALDISNTPRRVKMIARARSQFIFHASKAMQNFQRTDIVAMRTELSHSIGLLLKECELIKAGGASTITVVRPPEEFAPDARDSSPVRWFKRRRRLAAWITREPPSYQVPTEPLLAYLLEHRTPQIVDGAMRSAARHSYETAVEIGKLLNAIKATLGGARREETLSADFLAAEEARIATRVGELVELSKRQVQGHRTYLLTESRRLAQTLSDDLVRIDVLSRTRKLRRVPRSAAALADQLRDMPTGWSTSQHLVLRRADLTLAMAGLQRRFIAIVHRMKSAVVQELNAGIIREYEALLAALRAFLTELETDGGARLTRTLDFRKYFNARRLINGLVRETDSVLEDLPQTLNTVSEEASRRLLEDPFDEADATTLSVRRLVQFLIEAEFMGVLQGELDAIPEAEQRAVGTAQDALRLIQFNQSDFESHGDAEDGAFRAQLTPVVENSIARVEAELEAITALEPSVTDRIDRQLRLILERCSAYAITGSADSLKQYVRGIEGQRVLTTVGKGTRRVTAVARTLLADAIYRRSAGMMLARKLGETAVKGENIIDRVLRLVTHYTPAPEVRQSLPFYYSQLFLGKSAMNKAFWVGRTPQLMEAEREIQNYRRGHGGALMVIGDRGSGKSSLCQQIAATWFDHERIYNIYPPAGGSIDPQVFKSRLEKEVEFQGDYADIFLTLPEDSVIVLHGLESWWERSANGTQIIDMISSIIDQHSDRHLIICNMDVHAFALLNALQPFADQALGVIRCGPLSAQELKDIITLRHRSTGLRFELGGRTEGQLHQWRLAQLFTAHFDTSGGRIGTALQSWIAHVERVEGETITVRKPLIIDREMLDELKMEWVALLLQLVLHRSVTVERLERITGMPLGELQVHLRTLVRMGLVDADAQGIVELNRYVQHLIVDHLRERGMLA